MSVNVWSAPVPDDAELHRNSLRVSLWVALLAYGVYTLALALTADAAPLVALLAACVALHSFALVAFRYGRDLFASIWMVLVVLLCFTVMNTLAFTDSQAAEYYFILVPALIFMVLPPSRREWQISLLTLATALLTLTFVLPSPAQPWFVMSPEEFRRFKWLDVMVCFLCLAVVSRSFIHRLLRQRQQLERLALTDTLTGLPNRHGMMQRLTLWHNQDRPFTALLLDVDDFRQINRRQGYDVGDMLMRKLAQRLRTDLTEEILLARVGGDQFMMATDRITQPRDISDLMRRVQTSAARMSFDLNGRAERISVSVGATLGLACEQPQDLAHRLAQALRLARERTPARLYFLQPDMTPGIDASSESAGVAPLSTRL